MTLARPRSAAALALVVLAGTGAVGCYALRRSAGGGQTEFTPPRTVRAADVAVPEGYAVEAVATGLTFPTGLAFDQAGRPHVVESGYAYGEIWTTPRLLRIEPGGGLTEIARGGHNGPWTGVAFDRGAFYVAEGGTRDGGRLLRLAAPGPARVLLEGLPTRGDHHTNGPAVGPDGRVYLGLGTVTNAGVVGEDNAAFGWLRRFPELHDVPCDDVVLTGQNFRTVDPFAPSVGIDTGAFVPLGHATRPGQVVPGRVPCSGAVVRVDPDGGAPELVAWGFRNPFGLAFAPDGRLLATDNAYDDRGSRRVHGAGDLLWEVRPGGWHGWPDFHGDRPLDGGDRYAPPGGDRPQRLLAAAPGRPPAPLARFAVHAAAAGLDVSRDARFGHAGEAFVALFGDQAPLVGKILAPVGFKVVRVDLATGVIADFAVNRGRVNGPASRVGGGGLERPIAVRFDPAGRALYVIDFGVMTMTRTRATPWPGTGVVWRITRTAGP